MIIFLLAQLAAKKIKTDNPAAILYAAAVELLAFDSIAVSTLIRIFITR